MRILIVDDAQDVRTQLAMVFNRAGHSTRQAADGLEAVQAVELEQFDAIVMDMEMPRMNGLDATARIRQLPYGAGVPILMFTGYNNSDDYRRALAVGANDLVCKPLLPDALLAHINRLVDG